MPLQRLFHPRMYFCCMDLLERGRQQLLLRSSYKKWNGDRKFLLVLLQTLLLITLLSGLFLTSKTTFWQLLFVIFISNNAYLQWDLRWNLKWSETWKYYCVILLISQQYLLWPIFWHLPFALTTCILNCLFIMMFTWVRLIQLIPERCYISVSFSMWFSSPNTSN